MRLSSLSWSCAALLTFAGCKHVPSERDVQTAQIHYDLGVTLQQKDPQGAFKAYQEALKLDPALPEAHNAIALLLHVAFGRPEEAIGHYQEALRLRPSFSEARTNLANVYLDQKRYEDAIAQYEEVLRDMLYPTPYIAHGNLGWAYFRRGDAKKGIEHIRAALTMNPKFCLGHKNLGLIYDELGELEDSCRAFGHYRTTCPEVADAYYREGLCLAKRGDALAAREKLEACQTHAGPTPLGDDCRRLKDQLKLGP